MVFSFMLKYQFALLLLALVKALRERAYPTRERKKKGDHTCTP
jgi:hypothetical protein